MRFVDLFAGLGGFRLALKSLGHECVFASENDEELQRLYDRNFPEAHGTVFGDIRECKGRVPPHDILCAGFPCQPFSKSGLQNGVLDKTRGTLFHEIIDIVRRHRPRYVILENVGNFERHDAGRTWAVVRESLQGLAYEVRGTEHIRTGGHGLISPHHLGYPHTRERFYVVASRDPLPDDPFPPRDRQRTTRLADLLQSKKELSTKDREETSLAEQQVRCIDHWNKLLQRLPDDLPLPSFPIWGDEIGATYPFETTTPFATTAAELAMSIKGNGVGAGLSKQKLLLLLPSYARVAQRRFPDWKVQFLLQNRRWWREVRPCLAASWIKELRLFPASLRKLEWNCQGEERDLWRYVLQFRPSGLRSKRYSSCPALVAMTTTQLPVLGPKRRFITRTEGLRLQGFPDSHQLPQSRSKAFSALGNAVHVAVVRAIAEIALCPSRTPSSTRQRENKGASSCHKSR
jgi:DNA (cytosine-5)-methyltransferase 1